MPFMSEKDPNEQETERWKRLVAWLQTKGFDASQVNVEPRTRQGAGRGLYAVRTLSPSKKSFLVVPAASLLNSRTLSPIYPSIALEGFSDRSVSSRLVLNGTQLLSIHLALYRPIDNSNSNDPHFGPYIDTLPKELEGHPLSWIVKQKLGKADDHEARLLHNLPPSVLKELQGVAKRFWHDWDFAERTKKEYVEELKSKNKSLFDLSDFLWAWLVVNTRCLYSDIFRAKLPLSNLTLCPIVDFANHSNSALLPRAVWKDAPRDVRSRRGGELLKAHDYAFLPPDQTVDEGEEVFLKYGDHSNRTLFAEYGFVDGDADQEVDVSDLVNDLIVKKHAGRLIRELLPEIAPQFMSDLKLHAVPPPSYPSWSLLCVLRLINLTFPLDRDLNLCSAELEDILKPWRNVTLGEADLVSDANESSVRQDLESICEIVLARSSGSYRRLQSEDNGVTEPAEECAWYGWAKGCVVKLWEEETHVARTTLDSLASGEPF